MTEYTACLNNNHSNNHHHYLPGGLPCKPVAVMDAVYPGISKTVDKHKIQM